MVSETSNLIRLRLRGNLIIFFVPNRSLFVIVGSIFPVFPMRATAPPSHDENSHLVGKIEKVIRLKLSFEPNRIEVHVLDIGKLVFDSLPVEAQKHIRGPAAAANKNVLTVYFKDAMFFVVQLRGYLPDAEARILTIRYFAVRLKVDFEVVQILWSLINRPPHARMLNLQLRKIFWCKRDGSRFSSGKFDWLCESHSINTAADPAFDFVISHVVCLGINSQ